MVLGDKTEDEIEGQMVDLEAELIEAEDEMDELEDSLKDVILREYKGIILVAFYSQQC